MEQFRVKNRTKLSNIAYHREIIFKPQGLKKFTFNVLLKLTPSRAQILIGNIGYYMIVSKRKYHYKHDQLKIGMPLDQSMPKSMLDLIKENYSYNKLNKVSFF